MRIKRLEIVGFKSFCDRMVLNFDQPIVGVVGPNGCGKSNIVDAIRWCMGEQSAKHLRGKAMDDVIFAGSDSRKPSSMAEVSITFENDGRGAADLLSFSEVTVTRRLFRDGTSEYLLNKTPCRLRDVTDFFLGTGVGARAYAIIEQGRIGMIVSSKPEDRRALIEEAAGITKFKVKKKAAEKKMEWTRQNLLRVSDVVVEIEKQLGSLRRQAQKAERYKQYRAELRDIELWSASQRWLGWQATERVTAAALTEATRGKESVLSGLAAREAALEAERLQAAAEARRIEELQEALYELDNRIRLGEAQAEHEAKQAATLEERAESARQEVSELARQLEENAAELLRLRAESQAAEAGSAGRGEQLQEAEEEARMRKARLGEVQRSVDAAKGEIGRAQAEIARNEMADRSLVRRIEDLELRLARVGDEAGRLKEREDGLRASLDEHTAALDGLRLARIERQEQVRAAEARLGELKQAIAAAEQALDQLTQELHKKRSRHGSLSEIAQRYEGFQRGTRAIMQRRDADEGARWGVRGLVADVVAAPPEFEVAVEAALGERLGAVVVESPDAALDGVEYLKASNGGRTSFVPLKRRASDGAAETQSDMVTTDDLADGARRMIDLVRCDDECQPVARALLGDVLVVDDLLMAVDLYKAGVAGTLVTRDGEVVGRDGVVAGGSRDAKGAGVLQQKRELRALEGEVGELTTRHAQAVARATALKEERAALQATLETLRKEAHQGELQILTHEKDLSRFRDELERLRSRGQAIGADRSDLERQRDEAVIEAEEARLALRRSREALLAAEELRDGHGRDAVALIDAVEEAQSRLTELKVAAAQAEEQRRALVRAVMQTESQQRDREARRERLVRSLGEWAEEATGLRNIATARRNDLREQSVESRRRAEELSLARSGYEQQRARLMEVEGELKSTRAALERAGSEVAALELRLREARMNRAHLEEQIADRYRIDLRDELHAHHLRPLVGKAQEERLRELRDLIDRMGEINLTAIEEYQALEQRYQFLVGQKGDLEQAIAQLEEAIAQINRTSKQRFREVFDLVNARFQEIFPRLFRGGRAYLTLTQPDDLLESGIEIFAQPPGKKNATVELLSGGEKALTAVSLIFAIFLIKPSPFCLLDEVDAPLDEANVGRFNELVRAMTDRSQFIIITHNKRTMEIADTLYGVTMEEPGISKLVSVNLSGGSTTRQAA